MTSWISYLNLYKFILTKINNRLSGRKMGPFYNIILFSIIMLSGYKKQS